MDTIRRFILVLTLGLCAAAHAQDSLTSEGIVAAPVADVWAAFTTGAGLRSWMAPHADIDESQRMRALFERGNAYTVKKLQEKFAK